MSRPRVVVVTGASAGVGRACARSFAERGDKIALLARGEVGLQAAADEVVAAGGSPLVLRVDTSVAEEVETAADQVERELGPIDIWVNVAFTAVFARFLDIEPDEFRRVTDVTYHGYVNGTRAALRRMVPRNHGTVVQVGSALAYRGVPLQSAYCGSKHAIQGFNESVRTELLHDRSDVHLTMVQMPALNTPQFSWVLSRLPKQAQPVPPIYQPEIAARAILYAADHPRRKEYWVGASTAVTLIADKVASPMLDRYLARKGVASQQTDQPKNPHQPSNLWLAADGPNGHDFGAHGQFDDRAKGRSAQVWASTHRGAVAAGASLVGAGVLAARRWVR
jgi:NAD(P)-dependent dehydrogenase (short-subunit alcohol dehydrogenase family)